ncbi:hypothetical protein ES708_04052 [subsurface metagenome]
MSKHSLQGRLPEKLKHKQKLTSNTRIQNTKNLLIFAVVIILAAIPFGMGKYFEFNSPGPFDSGSNAYSAAHILDGAKIGVEEKPSAMVGTLLVNILGVWLFGFNDIGPKFIQMILQAAAIIFMFVAIHRLSGKLAAAVGAIITSVYLSAPLIAKLGNDKTQYLTAFMILGVSCFVLYQSGGKWFWAVLAGGFLSWGPLFKPVAASAIGATGLFVVLQPILKHRTWKQTGIDILLLFAGAAAAIGPLYIWIIGSQVPLGRPYHFVLDVVKLVLPATGETDKVKGTVEYVAGGRKLVSFSEQWPIVLRYYRLLILPIALAVVSIIARTAKMFVTFPKKSAKTTAITYDRFVILFAVWWILDMAFVWISPRSYEQYYLPLNASAAMLGGYVVALYSDKLQKTTQKAKWRFFGFAGLFVMLAMSWHIFFGIETSPHTGQKYGQKRRGYAQRLKKISFRRKNSLKGPWEIVGAYINTHSEPIDKIYVWGWFPGIYVQAQRFSSASLAFMMPRPTPDKFAESIKQLLTEFKEEIPEFIVDSRKRHIPTDRPAYELWPIIPRGYAGLQKEALLPRDEKIIAAFDKSWSDFLRKNYGDDEADRYELLRPFRQFIMDNYEIAEPQLWIHTQDGRLYHRMFGSHVVFRLKKIPSN